MSIIDSSIHNELENSVVKKSYLFYLCLKFINICRCLGFADKANIMDKERMLFMFLIYALSDPSLLFRIKLIE